MGCFSGDHFPETVWVKKDTQALPLLPEWQTPGEDEILRIWDGHEFD
jgi:hypothetical protein